MKDNKNLSPFDAMDQKIKEVLDNLTFQKLKDVHNQAYIKYQGIYGQLAKFSPIAECYFFVDTFGFFNRNCPQQRLLNMIQAQYPNDVKLTMEYLILIELFSSDTFDPKVISDVEAKELIDQTIDIIKKNLEKYTRQSGRLPQTDNLLIELDQKCL